MLELWSLDLGHEYFFLSTFLAVYQFSRLSFRVSRFPVCTRRTPMLVVYTRRKKYT